MSEQISDDACMKVALNSFHIGIDKPNGTNLGCVAFLETDTGRLTNRFFTASEALAAQAEIDRENEVSDTEALDLFRSMKEVESANLGPDGCGLGMMATLWLKAKKAKTR